VYPPLAKVIVTISTTQEGQKHVDGTYPVTISKGEADR